MSRSFVFTSESVSEGHPDKMADQVSDAVLDAILAVDPKARVACESLLKTGYVMLAGEITLTKDVKINYPAIVREAVRAIGYTAPRLASTPTPAACSSLLKSSPRTSIRVSTATTRTSRAPAIRA